MHISSGYLSSCRMGVVSRRVASLMGNITKGHPETNVTRGMVLLLVATSGEVIRGSVKYLESIALCPNANLLSRIYRCSWPYTISAMGG